MANSLWEWLPATMGVQFIGIRGKMPLPQTIYSIYLPKQLSGSPAYELNSFFIVWDLEFGICNLFEICFL